MFKYAARAAAILFFLLGLVGTAKLVWFVYVLAVRPALEQKWIQIPSPDESLVMLRVSDNGEVFADGEDGGLYQFVVSPEPAWVNVKETEFIYPGVTCRRISNDMYESEPTPEKTKILISVDCSFAEQGIYQDIALLENGETWYFEKTGNSYVMLGLILFVPIGVIIDLMLYVIGVFFLVLDIILTSRRKLKQNAA